MYPENVKDFESTYPNNKFYIVGESVAVGTCISNKYSKLIFLFLRGSALCLMNFCVRLSVVYTVRIAIFQESTEDFIILPARPTTSVVEKFINKKIWKILRRDALIWHEFISVSIFNWISFVFSTSTSTEIFCRAIFQLLSFENASGIVNPSGT